MQTAIDLGEQEAVEGFLNDPTGDSFRLLFRAISPQVLGYFRGRGCERGLAEDLTQDVMFAVSSESGRLRDRNLFRPWLFKIARNAWLQDLRREQRQLSTKELDAWAGSFGGREQHPGARSGFAEWMEWLEPVERQLVLLRYLEGLEYHEIASTLNIPLGTVQWKIFHSKRKLAARFGAPA
jgi:RNA polymerase sigma-70 factor (ECF subfamily)